MATKFLTNLDLNQNQILNAKFEVLASDPNTGNFEGRMIYNSTTDTIKVYSGAAWRTMVAGLTAGGSYTDAITISESNGTVTLTLNLADTDSAGLLSSTFWNLLNGATDAATGSTLAKRDSNAQIKVATTPTDNAHAASKAYVDSAVSGATVSSEQVQDIVAGQFVTNGVHSGITATYDDAGDGAIDLALDSTYSPTFAGLTINGASMTFEGATANDHETTITVTDPTADRTITVPDASGTLALLGTIALGTDTTGNYVNDITAGTGVSVTHTPGEGSSPTVAIGQAVGTADSPTFAGLTINGASIVLEGATANDHETTLTVTDPTADRTITFPDATGTVALAGSIALGTDTTGSYVASLVAGTGVTLSNNSGEGATPTVAIGQAVGTTDNVTFAGTTSGNVKVGVTGDNTIDTSTGSLTVTVVGATGSSPTAASVSIEGGSASGTGTVTAGGVTISGGYASDGTTNNGGIVQIDGGYGSTTSGYVNIGTAYASAVGIGRNGITTTINGSAVISGDLTVNGTTTTVNSTTVTVDDKNLELGSTASPSDAGADGGGITLKGTTDKTLTWVDSTDAWTSSEHLNLVSGKVYMINGATVLSGNTLGSGVTSSSLTTVGTITTGVWNGTDIAVADGGTGASTASSARTNLADTPTLNLTTSTPVLARIASQACDASVAGTSTTVVTHNFDNTDVIVQVFEVATGATVVADVVRTNSDQVTVTMLGTISAQDYTIVVTG